MDEVNLLRQERLQLRICLTRQILRTADGSIDTLHHILQIADGALFLRYHSLPVPLVHIQRVQVVQFLVGTDGIHIRIDTMTRLNIVFCQRQTLPFGQRVHHFGTGITQILDGEGHSALHTIQIVVNTQALQHKQWSSHTTQPQLR